MGFNILSWVCLFSLIVCQVWTKELTQKETEDVIQLLEDSVQDFRQPGAPPLKIGAFNIAVFGESKMGKPEVVKILRKILVRYDVVLIQEVRDASGRAIVKLLNEVNKEGGMAFKMEISERLGRTSSKEQYAYFYRFSRVQVVSTHQYSDAWDTFERPPFIVRFKAPGTQIKEFGFIGIHVKPSDAVAEIDALTDVYDHMKAQWRMENFILGGDFNAGCSYLKPSDWKNIRLRQQRRFSFIIGDNVKTNVARGKDCPYDRFVLGGADLMMAHVQGTAVVYRFDKVHNLSFEETWAVSDHYPIEFSLR